MKRFVANPNISTLIGREGACYCIFFGPGEAAEGVVGVYFSQVILIGCCEFVNNGVFGKAVADHDEPKGSVCGGDEVLLHPVHQLVDTVGVTGTGGGIYVIAYDVIGAATEMPYAPGALACAHGHEHHGGIFNTHGKVVFAEMVFDGGDVVGIAKLFVVLDNVVQFCQLLDGSFAAVANQEHEAESGAAALGEQVEGQERARIEAFCSAAEPLPDALVAWAHGGFCGFVVVVGAGGQAECFPEVGSEELFIGEFVRQG